MDELFSQISTITQTISSYADFANRNLRQLIDPVLLDEALQKQLTELHSIVLLNRGDGTFLTNRLPFEAQLFPLTSIYSEDITGNGAADLLIAGNIFKVKPSYGGRQDAGFGLLLEGDGSGKFESLNFNESGFLVNGQARSIFSLKQNDGENVIIVARNNDTPLFFTPNND